MTYEAHEKLHCVEQLLAQRCKDVDRLHAENAALKNKLEMAEACLAGDGALIEGLKAELAAAQKAAGIELSGWSEIEQGFRRTDGGYFRALTHKADAFDLAMKYGMYIDFFGGFVGALTGEERRFTPHNHAECCEAIVLAAAEMERSKGKWQTGAIST